MSEHQEIKITKQTDPAEEAQQQELAKMYASKKRPLCHCRNPGLEMYIAKIDDHYIVKRMPDTGALHAPTCESYEPPPELSGLGEVLGSAIKETADGKTDLNFNFSMIRFESSRIIVPKEDEDDLPSETKAVKAPPNKLSLEAVLYYLWDQAGLNKWSPAMEGKRNWYSIYYPLVSALTGKQAKGASLAEKFYIPEPLRLEKKDEITRRRVTRFASAISKKTNQRPCLMLLGEVKSFGPSKYGSALVLKHSKEHSFYLGKQLSDRVQRKHRDNLALLETGASRLMTIGTFSVSTNGITTVEELTFVPVNANYIPFDSSLEQSLINSLTEKHRHFTKCLRYNLDLDTPIASVVLNDTEPQQTAMYILPPESSANYIAAQHRLIEGSVLASWVWDVEKDFYPEIPPPPGGDEPITETADEEDDE